MGIVEITPLAKREDSLGYEGALKNIIETIIFVIEK
jgi:hypothetical protein